MEEDLAGAASEDSTEVSLMCLWALTFRIHRKEGLPESQRKKRFWRGRVSCGPRRGVTHSEVLFWKGE